MSVNCRMAAYLYRDAERVPPVAQLVPRPPELQGPCGRAYGLPPTPQPADSRRNMALHLWSSRQVQHGPSDTGPQICVCFARQNTAHASGANCYPRHTSCSAHCLLNSMLTTVFLDNLDQWTGFGGRDCPSLVEPQLAVRNQYSWL